MRRRRFLAGLLGSAAAAAVTATVDPEALLWTPGKVAFFDMGAGARARNEALGVLVRLVNHFHINAGEITRFDVLYGHAVLEPSPLLEMAREHEIRERYIDPAVRRFCDEADRLFMEAGGYLDALPIPTTGRMIA